MFNVRAEAAPGKLPTLQIFDDIGSNDSGGGVTVGLVRDFLRQNAQAPGIRVEICSDGGDVETGLAIYQELFSSRLPIHTCAYGRVASAASIIFLAGTQRSMDSEAELMIHYSFVQFPEATAVHERELETMTRAVYEANRRMERIISSRTGQSREQVEAWMREETFFDAEQAKKLGFVTDIVGIVSTPLPVNAMTQPVAAEDPALSMLAKYTKTFGAKSATHYIRAGLNWVQSLERHHDRLRAKLATLQTETARAKEELTYQRAVLEFLKTGSRHRDSH